MRVISVNDYESRALKVEHPDYWQWHVRNFVRMRAQDVADHFVDEVEVRCGDSRVCKITSHHTGREA